MKTKQTLRKEIAQTVKSHSREELNRRSAVIMAQLEQTTRFQQATVVALFYSLPDEIDTTAFIKKWAKKKQLLLPVVDGEEMTLHPYDGEKPLRQGALKVFEPTPTTESRLHVPQLIIVPGVAFDRSRNRLGRGKGYYDRFLTGKEIPTIGLCFDFQLFDTIPVDPHDRPLDAILSEHEQIGLL